ncbi:MAG: hypothetical protein H6757_02900 [Candidatus Omnitrophica bacterium]|nr:hypothetical protein [Candidatus Omnitrophota bacterium]
MKITTTLILSLLLSVFSMSGYATESVFEKYNTDSDESRSQGVSIFRQYQSNNNKEVHRESHSESIFEIGDDRAGHAKKEDKKAVSSIFDLSSSDVESGKPGTETPASLTGPIVKGESTDAFSIEILGLKAAKREVSSYGDMTNNTRELNREKAMVAKQSWKSKMAGHNKFDDLRDKEKYEQKQMEKKREERRQSWMEKQQAFMAARRAAIKAREEQWERERHEAQQKR